ncbi:hypothetical protein GIB67_042844, partial [Kingdonia uniflora]
QLIIEFGIQIKIKASLIFSTTLSKRSRSRYSRRLQLIHAHQSHYKGTQIQGTRGNYNLFQHILGASPMSSSNTMFKLN